MCSISSVKSQDLIIKTDKTEIKSKVIEITENHIKYKIWTRKDGPTYNIKKSEVFLIIYETGEKEYYGEAIPNNEQSPINKPQEETIIALTEITKPETKPVVTPTTTTTEDDFFYPTLGKINLGFGNDNASGLSTIGLGIIYPIPFSNYGLGNFEFELTSNLLSSSGSVLGVDINTNIYAFSGAFNYGYFVVEDLKISGGAGYYFGFGTITSGTTDTDISVDNFYYQVSADYLFTKGFGINVRFDEFLGFNFGISFSY